MADDSVVRFHRRVLESMDKKLTCNYDDCSESFETHENRLEHSMSEHTDLNPKRYPNMTGQDSGLKF